MKQPFEYYSHSQEEPKKVYLVRVRNGKEEKLEIFWAREKTTANNDTT